MSNRYAPPTRQDIENPDLLLRHLQQLYARLSAAENTAATAHRMATDAHNRAMDANTRISANVTGHAKDADTAIVSLGFDQAQWVRAKQATSTSPPNASTDANQGYSVGSEIIVNSADVYKCVNAKVGGAVWKLIS